MKRWTDVRREIKSIRDEEKEEVAIAANLVASLIDKRMSLGLSQRQLAEQAGVKQAAIARLESFHAIPRIDTLVKLSKPLGLELKLVDKENRDSLLV